MIGKKGGLECLYAADNTFCLAMDVASMETVRVPVVELEEIPASDVTSTCLRLHFWWTTDLHLLGIMIFSRVSFCILHVRTCDFGIRHVHPTRAPSCRS